MLRLKVLVLGAVLLTFPTMAQALEVFGNDPGRDAGAGGANVYSTITGQAIPFTTGTTTTDLNRLVQSAWVLVGGNTSDVTMNVRIYADANTNGGPTGSALASGSLVVPASTPATWLNVAFSSAVQLADNTNYYLAVEASSGLNFAWYNPAAETSYSNFVAGSDYSITGGTGSFVWTTSGGSWSDSLNLTVASRPMGFQIVPEPSTYALASIATLALTMTARRRKMGFRKDSI